MRYHAHFLVRFFFPERRMSEVYVLLGVCVVVVMMLCELITFSPWIRLYCTLVKDNYRVHSSV